MYVSKVYEMAVDSYGDVRTLVRGLPYQCPNDWEDVLDSLDEDSNLYLIKEPDNSKDKLAIAVYLDDRRVGYVAASDNGKIWLYMTDEKMPCTFIESFEASFKISFENPRPLFEGMPFKEIYKDKFGVTEQPFPAFEIPFLSNPKDKHYEWFDDRIYIADLERAIPDFRRKLATRMIIIAGRKDSKGEYNYYLPYANNPVADVEDDIIKGIIDRYGFVIALPDVPIINTHGGILMDLHVTFLKNANFKDFNIAHQSELVFNLVRENKYKYQFAADNPSTSGRNDNDDGKQNNAMEEVDMFMQEPQSTPSYSKSDYILKKDEVATSSIDKSTFAIIDKVTTELYSFVRQTLFPYTELFSYLKKHTPYYDQFYDFGQFETLIRVFVIKDLGRIYKGLNHSFNFDTIEGKALFLYMEKDSSENPEISYETFNEICNPKSRVEAAPKMREVIGNLMKSFYEYDIALWTDTDFVIHSFLKEVDNKLAKRYMELMCQFASTVTGGNEHTIDSSTQKSDYSETKETAPVEENHEDEYYSVTDSPGGGKQVSMGVIVPEEGDEDFDFCSFKCTIRDKDKIDVIRKYMKRYEAGLESRPFLMMGRILFGTSNMYVFYSLDGEIIFDFIFDDKIKRWIKEAGFVLGKVKEYHFLDLTGSLDLTISVSKRKSGETLFKQAYEEAMDYIEEEVKSTADSVVEGKIKRAVKKYMTGKTATPYKVLIIPKYGGTCTTLDGEEIATITDDEIIELAEKNKGVFGHIISVDYDEDGKYDYGVWFTIRVSRSVPRLTLES